MDIGRDNQRDQNEKVPLKQSNLIILGAGRPFRGEQHVGLRGTGAGSRVLDWLLHAVRDLSLQVNFVGGYQIEDVARQYPDFQYTVNPRWDDTKAASSLLEVFFQPSTECYVSYVDILFRDTVIADMAASEADIVIAADTQWRDRFPGRTQEDMRRSEKVNLAGLSVTRLGSDIESDYADAEFIGLVRLSAKAVDILAAEAGQLADRMKSANLSELIEFLRTRGLSVDAVDVAGDWAELNESSDLAQFVLGTKAETLSRLGGLVKNSQIEDQVSFTVGRWEADSASVIAEVLGMFGDLRLVVRSSALSEDGFSSANAGAYDSVLNVDGTDTAAVHDAIQNVIQSYPDGDPANQVLVQPMVSDVVASGVAFTRTLDGGGPYYVVNYDDVSRSTESITSGTSKEHKTLVSHRNAPADNKGVPEVVRGLIPAIREIEALLSYDALDIEFAISGTGKVHVLQVRPIAVDHGERDISDDQVWALTVAAGQKFGRLQRSSPFVTGARAFFGVMPDWNPAEIIGTHPDRLATGLYRYLIMDETWARQRAEYGYRDVRPSPLLVSFCGRPYVDIRASFNSFLPASIDDDLAERLVNFYMGWLEANPHLHDKVEFDVVPTCFGLNFESWETRLIEAGGFSPTEVAKLRDGLKSISRQALGRNERDLKAIARLEGRFEQIMSKDMAPLNRATVLLEDCRNFGTLPFAHLARSGFVAVTLLRTAVDKGVISKEAADSFLNSIRTVSHGFTDDAILTAKGHMSWEAFVDRYGHLRPGTYDITSPCYAADAELYLRPIVERAQTATHDKTEGTVWKDSRAAFAKVVAESGLSDDIDMVERFMRDAIEGREYAKFAFSRNLSAAIECLAEFGRELGLERDVLCHIPLETFFTLRSGGVTTDNLADWLRAQADDGKRQGEVAKMTGLPPLLFRELDFSVFMYPSTQPNFVGSGRVTAECVDLSQVPSGTSVPLTGKIAMIPQADPGYDWLFGQEISGLITMYGGANSHMAIRAAEFGLPAAIGVGESLYAELVGAQALELDAGNRRIQVIG